MKNFFQKKQTNKNPFMEDSKGDDINTMSEEINEQEINQEQTDNTAEAGENTGENENENNSPADVENEEITEDNAESEEAKLKNDLDKLNNQYLRLAADFDNYRKRQVQEREALLKFGAEECMKKVLEVVDNFDRAINMVEKIDNIEKMKETFFVLGKQLNDSMAKLGLEQIKSVGEKFDPNLHEAVMQTPTNEYPEETIINELQKGYKLGEKVLRPAMVSVAVKE